MHYLVRTNKIAELENWKAHLAKTDENKENLFHSAAYGGNEETWTYLFDNGLKDIDQENRWDTFPIQIACVKNNSAALKFLLDKKANIDVKVKGYYYYGGGDDYGGLGYYGDDLLGGDNLLHICVRSEARACLLLILPVCKHLIDVKNDSGDTPREIDPQFWEAVVKVSDAKAGVVQVPAPTLASPICEGRPYDAIKEVAELKAALLLSDTARAQSEARAVEAEARVAAARAEAANSKTEAANLKAALVIAEAKAASYEDAKARAEAKAAAADSARVQMEATVAEFKVEAAAAKAESAAAKQAEAKALKEAADHTRLELPVLETDFVETDADKRELASPSRGVSNAAPASHAAPDIDEMKLELKKIRSTQSERKTELENLHKKKDFVEEKFSLLTVKAKKNQTEFKHIRGELEKKRTEHSAVLGLVRKWTQLCDEDSRKALELESGIAKFALAKKEALKIAQAALDATQAEGKLLVAAQVHLAEIRHQHKEDEVLPTTTQAFLAARGCLSTEVQARLGNLSQPPSMREIKKMFEALEKEKARVEAVEQKALSALQQGSNSGSDLDNIVKELFKVLPDLVVVGIERHEAQTKTSLD